MATFISKKHLSRRSLLRGVGTVVALPFLESMVPAATTLAQTRARPTSRLGCFYFPHGATMSRWTPAGEGKHFTFSEILEPLAPFRDRLNIISNLGLPLAYGPGGATANHNRSSATYLSGAEALKGAQAHLGVTMDQVAAEHIGQDTPLPSMELMIEETSLSCGEGLSCAYRNTISWRDATTPLPMQNNPQVVFEQLFGDGATEAQREARRRQSLSLLDAVTGEINTLQHALPTADRVRLDAYLTDIREIERRITQASEKVTEDIDIPPRPTGIPDDVEEHIKLMFDLIAVAWQTEITRIASFLLAKELSTAVYPGSGVRDSFHTLSHHSNNEDNKARFALINRYHVSLFARFLEKLDNISDGDGTLLDHSMILYGSGMSDGNSHNHDPLPIVLAGGASGRLQGNRHIVEKPGTTMSNLLLAMLDKLDIHQESFGDSTGMLTL